jgi:hypothetical protein
MANSPVTEQRRCVLSDSLERHHKLGSDFDDVDPQINVRYIGIFLHTGMSETQTPGLNKLPPRILACVFQLFGIS